MMEKEIVQQVALCAVSAVFGAIVSYVLTSRAISTAINTKIEKEKDKVHLIKMLEILQLK